MIIDRHPEPKSSFLSMEKDLHLISNMILRNPRLKKLLYYTTPNCLDMPAVSEEKTIEMFGKNIKIVPKLYVDNSVLNYIIISFDNFTRNATNPELRDQWKLKDFQLRPYKIAAEIDSMFNDKHLTGIGKLEFLGANQMILTDEYAGLCLMYSAIHGEEDKTNMQNPQDQKQFEKDFNELMGL